MYNTKRKDQPMGADMMVAICHDYSSFSEEQLNRAIDLIDDYDIEDVWVSLDWHIDEELCEKGVCAASTLATRNWLKDAARPLFREGRRDIARLSEDCIAVGGMSWGDAPEWYNEIAAFDKIGGALDQALIDDHVSQEGATS